MFPDDLTDEEKARVAVSVAAGLNHMRQLAWKRSAATLNTTPPDTTAPTVEITCTQSSPSATTPLNMTFTFSEVVTGFEIGDITVGNGTAGNFAGTGAVYTCDVTPTGMSVVTVDVAEGVAQDAASNTNTAATQFTLTSTAPFSDAFTRSDGAIGSIWTGATWTVASNVALNTPTQGAELITNGNFSAWTADNPNGWSVVGEVASDPYVNEVGAGQGQGGAGTGLCNLYRTASEINIRQTILTAGQWYRAGFLIDTFTSGALRLRDRLGGFNETSYTTTGTKLQIGRAAFNEIEFTGTANPTDVTIDDVSFKQLTLASLFGTLPNVSAANVTAQVVITVVPNGSQGGLVLNLDSTSSPANFVVAYLNTTGTGTLTAKLDKCVAGTYTNVISASVVFGATKYLKVIKSGDSYSLYYGTTDVQVGTTQTIASMNGTIHGLFSTDSTQRFDSYQLSVTP
jgi:hypothetical protein